MNCKHARKLYAAFWDDETTQAEREWLEGHFTSCPTCRREYEQYARTLELMGSLPRIEPAAELPERVLQRVRRAETVPDAMPAARPLWVPIGSAVAACALLALTLAGPWTGGSRETGTASRVPDAVSVPVLVETPAAPAPASGLLAGGAEPQAAGADSLFDHSEDIEFILDPVVLHRGRASVNRTGGGTADGKAVITF